MNSVEWSYYQARYMTFPSTELSKATQLTEAEWLLHDHLTIAFHAAAPSLPQRFDQFDWVLLKKWSNKTQLKPAIGW